MIRTGRVIITSKNRMENHWNQALTRHMHQIKQDVGSRDNQSPIKVKLKTYDYGKSHILGPVHCVKWT